MNPITKNLKRNVSNDLADIGRGVQGLLRLLILVPLSILLIPFYSEKNEQQRQEQARAKTMADLDRNKYY